VQIAVVIVVNLYYRTWPMLIGPIMTIALFLVGFVFFIMSFQY
jgi:hypothetical protein